MSNVLLDYVYAVIDLYRGERLCNIMHHLKVQRTILNKKKSCWPVGHLFPASCPLVCTFTIKSIKLRFWVILALLHDTQIQTS